MDVDQLPRQVREFANYLEGLLARLDENTGWAAVFWQRDQDGMQACLEGREVPPWDVVEALLQDFAAEYGNRPAEQEAERARPLHAAALVAYDARPGARASLGDRLDVMLREQRYAAERQGELSRLLAAATTQEDADAIRLDLAWAHDDHERATARCAELRYRLEELDRRAAGDAERGAQAIHQDAARAERAGPATSGFGYGTGAAVESASGSSGYGAGAAADSASGSSGYGTGRAVERAVGSSGYETGAVDAASRASGPGGWAPGNASGASGTGAWTPDAGSRASGSGAPRNASGASVAGAWSPDAASQQSASGAWAPAPDDIFRPLPSPTHNPYESDPWITDGASRPTDTQPAAPVPAQADQPTSTPSPKQRKRRRGSARFAGMVEEEAAPVVVPTEAVVPTLPTPAATGGRTPRGARFAGAAEQAEVVPEARVEAVDTADRRETAEAVQRLVRLRGEGRSGEAHALLVEFAYWPAPRIPLLAAELQHAGLGADWTTLLWEVASLPADRLVAAADALVAAGRPADGEQILRQGVVRPADEIGEAVRGLAAEGRRRQAGALLDAYVRMCTPEEASRCVAPDPKGLVPLLLEAAQGVSDTRHRDLVHALRVAGFTT